MTVNEQATQQLREALSNYIQEYGVCTDVFWFYCFAGVLTCIGGTYLFIQYMKRSEIYTSVIYPNLKDILKLPEPEGNYLMVRQAFGLTSLLLLTLSLVSFLSISGLDFKPSEEITNKIVSSFEVQSVNTTSLTDIYSKDYLKAPACPLYTDNSFITLDTSMLDENTLYVESPANSLPIIDYSIQKVEIIDDKVNQYLDKVHIYSMYTTDSDENPIAEIIYISALEKPEGMNIDKIIQKYNFTKINRILYSKSEEALQPTFSLSYTPITRLTSSTVLDEMQINTKEGVPFVLHAGKYRKSLSDTPYIKVYYVCAPDQTETTNAIKRQHTYYEPEYIEVGVTPTEEKQDVKVNVNVDVDSQGHDTNVGVDVDVDIDTKSKQ